MHARRTKVAVIMLSAAVLSQASAYGAYAASTTTSSTKTATTTTVSTLDKLGSLALKSNFSVKLSDVGFLTQDGGNILTYTLSYYNGSGSSINLVEIPNGAPDARGGAMANGAAGTRNRGNSDQRTVSVEVGIHDESSIEIVSGLNEGDKVIIPTVISTKTGTTSTEMQMQGGMGGAPGGGGGGSR